MSTVGYIGTIYLHPRPAIRIPEARRIYVGPTAPPASPVFTGISTFESASTIHGCDAARHPLTQLLSLGLELTRSSPMSSRARTCVWLCVGRVLKLIVPASGTYVMPTLYHV